MKKFHYCKKLISLLLNAMRRTVNKIKKNYFSLEKYVTKQIQIR